MRIRDFLLFQRFIMPYALQFLFWSGIAGVLYGSWWLFTHDNWAWMPALVFGTLVTRLLFESMILRYQTHVLLIGISDKLHAGR